MNRPKYRMMIGVLNQCAKKNLGKAVFAVFLCSTLQLFSLMIPMALQAVMMSTGGSGAAEEAVLSDAGASIALIPLVLISFSIILILNYGLFTIMARMVEKKFVTIGFLFSGFKQLWRSVRAVLLYLVLYLLVAAAGVAVILIAKINPNDFMSVGHGLEISQTGIIFTVSFMIVLGAVLLPFSFVWLIMANDPQIKPIKAFGYSARLLFKNYFHFFGFLVTAGGVYLVAFIALSVLSELIPPDVSGFMKLVSFLMSFGLFITQYISFVRIYLAFPVYFYSITGAIRFGSAASDSAHEPEPKQITQDDTTEGQ